MKERMLNISTFGDNKNGKLSFFESNKTVPFEIKRIYYTYDVPSGVKRGFHAHKNLKQLMWCPFGSIEVLIDDGINKSYYLLDSPEKAILVFENEWREIKFILKNSILCVAASDYYNEDDYIKDYQEFIKYLKK